MSQETTPTRPEAPSHRRKLSRRQIGRAAVLTPVILAASLSASTAVAKPANSGKTKKLNAAVHKEAALEAEQIVHLAKTRGNHGDFNYSMLGTDTAGIEEVSVTVSQPKADKTQDASYHLIAKLPGPPGEGFTRGPKPADIKKDNPHKVTFVTLTNEYVSLGLIEQKNGDWLVSDGYTNNNHLTVREASTDPKYHGQHVTMGIVQAVHREADILLSQAQTNAPDQSQAPAF